MTERSLELRLDVARMCILSFSSFHVGGSCQITTHLVNIEYPASSLTKLFCAFKFTLGSASRAANTFFFSRRTAKWRAVSPALCSVSATN